MSIWYIIISVALIIACIALIVIILEQSKRTSGIGNLSGMSGGGGGQSYWDNNKKHSKEGKLERYTKILALVFVGLTILLLIIR